MGISSKANLNPDSPTQEDSIKVPFWILIKGVHSKDSFEHEFPSPSSPILVPSRFDPKRSWVMIPTWLIRLMDMWTPSLPPFRSSRVSVVFQCVFYFSNFTAAKNTKWLNTPSCYLSVSNLSNSIFENLEMKRNDA